MVVIHKRRTSFVYGGDGFSQKRRIVVSGHYNNYLGLHVLPNCGPLNGNVHCWVRIVKSPAVGAGDEH